MPNPPTIITPNMNISNPVPQVDPGPDYANNIFQGINIIDAHNHDPNDDGGVQIDLAKQLVESNINFNSTDLTVIRSVELNNNNSTLTSINDVNCLYVVDGELYFNESNGNPVQITVGGAVNLSGVFNNYSVQAVTNANYTILTTDNFTAIDVSTTSTASTIHLPQSSAVAVGRFFVIKDVGGLAGTNNITITPHAGDQFENGASSVVIDNNQGFFYIFTDAAGRWYVISSNITLANQSINVHSGGFLFLQSGSLVDGQIQFYNANSSNGLTVQTVASDVATTALIISGQGAYSGGSNNGGDIQLNGGQPSTSSQTWGNVITHANGNDYSLKLHRFDGTGAGQIAARDMYSHFFTSSGTGAQVAWTSPSIGTGRVCIFKVDAIGKDSLTAPSAVDGASGQILVSNASGTLSIAAQTLNGFYGNGSLFAAGTQGGTTWGPVSASPVTDDTFPATGIINSSASGTTLQITITPRSSSTTIWTIFVEVLSC